MPVHISKIGSATAADAHSLGIARVRQEKSQWCWAACGEMLARHVLKTHIAQCDFVNTYTGGKGLCQDACQGIGNCNVPCQTSKIAGIYATKGMLCRPMPVPASATEICEQIVDARRPIMAMLTFDNLASHVLLITGYRATGSGPALYAIDTRDGYGEGWVDYGALLNAHGHGRWVSSWSDFRSK